MNIYFPEITTKAFDPFPNYPNRIFYVSNGKFIAFTVNIGPSHVKIFDLSKNAWSASFYAYAETYTQGISFFLDNSNNLHTLPLAFTPHYKVFNSSGNLLRESFLSVTPGTQLGLYNLTQNNDKVEKGSRFTFHLDFTFLHPNKDFIFNNIVEKLKPYNFNVYMNSPPHNHKYTNRVLIYNNREVDINPNIQEGGASVVGGATTQSEFINNVCYVQLDLSKAMGIHARQILHELIHNVGGGHSLDSNSVMFENTQNGPNFNIDPQTDAILKLF